MEFKDYYNILGVKPDAGSKEIKAAYRKLALKYHPDMNSDARAEAKFKELAEAYKVLKHPKRRAEYDQLRQYGQQSSHGFRPPPGWRSTSYAEEPDREQFEGDFSEFFNSIFGQHRATFRQRASTAPQRGQDIEIELPLFLEETIQQTHKTIEYQLPVFGNGRLEHVTKQLKIKVPMGSCDGERIRVPGQGTPVPVVALRAISICMFV
ncbi:DnaJ domain-containing protein [Agarivorans sp. QJM3NY_25]|uniref:DnaJ domain-containing protein n=1 Tax=Agarivorans sp. QJM3NY_25 TaxID=3421430 RepID=UPI003D7CEC54